jgi:hypothetical protein
MHWLWSMKAYAIQNPLTIVAGGGFAMDDAKRDGIARYGYVLHS